MNIKLRDIVGGLLTGPIGTIAIGQYKRWREKQQRTSIVDQTMNLDEYNELAPEIEVDEIDPETVELKSVGTENELDAATSIISELINQGMLMKSYTGMLRCNININALAKGGNGTYYGWRLASNGHIAEYAKFSKVGVPTPLVAFQVLSFVTGLYYQQILTEQLSSLGTKMSDAVDHMEADDKGTIQMLHEALTGFFERKNYMDADYLLAEQNMQQARRLQLKYRELIERTTVTAAHSLLNNKGEIDNWSKSLQESGFLRKMTVAYQAELLQFTYNALLARMYTQRDGMLSERAQSYLLKMEPEFGKYYAEKFHRIKHHVLENVRRLAQSADHQKAACNLQLKQLESAFAHIERLYSKGQAQLAPTPYYQISEGRVTGIYIPEGNNNEKQK